MSQQHSIATANCARVADMLNVGKAGFDGSSSYSGRRLQAQNAAITGIPSSGEALSRGK